MTVFSCDFAAFSLFRRLLWRLAQLDAFPELTLAFNQNEFFSYKKREKRISCVYDIYGKNNYAKNTRRNGSCDIVAVRCSRVKI